MSRSVDQHVVEMQFDNKHFEQNVSTTMSTIEKLKQKLNFSGAAKGLEDINTASKKVDMAGLGTAVESVNAKFSALQVMGVTALANITNSAVNAGKRIVSALTIDPVKMGFQEYETQINAVQTILANTQSKGTTIDDVNRALDELNKYADLTIYNFTEMTRNIGTFTAAGVDLDTSVSAIQGIANLAAVSGSTSQQASTAMYQLSQALAAGTVKLMDWNSVVNAGMGGEVFQKALVRTAKNLDSTTGSWTDLLNAIDSGDAAFRETLTEGWLTSEVLTETLKQFTMAAEEGSKEWDEFKKSLMDQGYTEAQATEILKMANTATEAATKVKTFTQLWDVLKEAAQSGWTQTWETIIGDYEEAKETISSIADVLTGFINKMSDARNWLVQGAFDFASPWSAIMKKLEGAGFGNIKKVAETIENATEKLEYFQKIVNDVWRGDYNNSDTGRYELLEAAGYDHRVVQDLVNLGYGYKITVEDIEASHKKFGLTMEKSAEETQDVAAALENLTDEQLRNAGLTEDEIKLYRDLAAEAKRTGKSISELADEMSKNDGRTLLIDSFKNAGSGLLGLFTALKNAWVEIFPPMSIVQLYNIIKGINEFSEKLRLTDKSTGELTDTAKKLQRVFKGVFALVDIFATILGGTFKIAIQAVSALLGYFGTDILTVSAALGDALVKFRDWIDAGLDFGKAFDKIIPFIKRAIDSFKDWKDSLSGAENLPKAIAEGIVKWFGYLTRPLAGFIEKIKSFLTGGFESIPGDMISGFANGIWNGIKIAGQVMLELGKIIISKIKDVLGIHSPSTVFFAIGGFVIAGLIGGLLSGSSDLKGTIEGIGAKLAEWFGAIDFGALFTAVISAGAVIGVNKIGSALEALAAPFEGVGEVLEGTGEVLGGFGKVLRKSARPIAKILKSTAKVVKSFANVMNGIAFNIATKGIQNLAISIGILVAAVIALAYYAGTEGGSENLKTAVLTIAALAGILAGLAVVVGLMSKSSVEIGKGGAKINGLKTSLLSIAGALLLLAITLKIVGSMKPEQYQQACEAMVGLIIGIGVLIAAYGLLVKGKAAQNMDKAGTMLIKMAGAMAILAIVAKLIAGMTWDDMKKAGVGLAGLVGVVLLLTLIGKIDSKGLKNVSNNLLKISTAMLILEVVAKLIAEMTWDDMGKAAVGLSGLVGIVALLMLVGKIDSKGIDSVGANILTISGAMSLLAITAKIIASMSWPDMAKAGVGLTALSAIVVGLVWGIGKVSDKDLVKVGTTLLALSIAIGILGLVTSLLGFLSIEHLAKGIIAVGLLGAVMTAMIWATKGASDCKSNLIVMTIAIGVMAAAVAALSLIKPERLAVATGAMSALMGMFAVIIKAGSNVKSSMSALIVMTVAVGVLGGVLYLLSTLPIESTIGAATSLSILLIAVSGALVLLSKMSITAGSALKGVLLLTAMAIPLLAFVGVFALMQNVQNATENAKTLTLLATVLTLLMIPLALVGALWAPAAMGIAALTAMAVPLRAFVGILALMQNIQNASENVEVLTTLMTLLTGMLVVLAIVGPLALVGVTALAALTALITGISVMVVAIGYLMDKFPMLEEFADKGIAVLEKLCYGIGSFVGNIVAGFAGAIAEALPGIGTCLSDFMTNATPFITGIKMVDSSVLENVGYLAGAILLLTAADLISGVMSFLGGGSSFATLGTELSMFMMNALPFITSARMIDPAIMEGVKALAQVILILTAADVLDGLTSWFTGGSSLASFGEQLPQLGADISAFATSLGGFNESNVTSVTCAANAIKALAEAADSIPNEGGWAAKIFGDNSIGAFSEQLPKVATNLSSFGKNLGTFDETTVATVSCAADAIVEIAEASKSIPNDGGWAAKLFGDNSIATFGAKLPKLGTDLGAFANNLGTFNEDKVATVTCAAEAISLMAKAAEGIDGQSKWAAKLFGDNSLAAFGEDVAKLGTSLKGFATNLGTFNKDKVSTVTSAVDAVNAFSKLAAVDLGDAKKHIGDFGDKIIDFAKDLSGFCSNMPATSTISTAVANVKNIITMLKDVGSANANAASEFAKSLKDLAKNGIKAFIDEFSSNTYKKDAKSAATELTNQVVKGFEDGQKSVKKAGGALADAGAEGLEGKYDTYYDAGYNLVTGFAAGISENDYIAEAKAAEMARAAAKAAKAALNINSPSKVFKEIGTSVPEGFAMGIDKLGTMVAASSTDMTDVAVAGVKDSLSHITDIINGNIDTQPTIRPVLDLSGVESRAGILSRLFNTPASMGVLANIGAISASMNSSQNGSNDDVVSAIDRLYDLMSGSRGDTYNINGVTYDDGSNIKLLLEAIIQQARIEGRA